MCFAWSILFLLPRIHRITAKTIGPRIAPGGADRRLHQLLPAELAGHDAQVLALDHVTALETGPRMLHRPLRQCGHTSADEFARPVESRRRGNRGHRHAAAHDPRRAAGMNVHREAVDALITSPPRHSHKPTPGGR